MLISTQFTISCFNDLILVRCEPNSNHGFGVDKPTLIFVVRVREEMNAVMQQVQQAVDEVSKILVLLKIFLY